jgi:hypothetical protein
VSAHGPIAWQLLQAARCITVAREDDRWVFWSADASESSWASHKSRGSMLDLRPGMTHWCCEEAPWHWYCEHLGPVTSRGEGKECSCAVRALCFTDMTIIPSPTFIPSPQSYLSAIRMIPAPCCWTCAGRQAGASCCPQGRHCQKGIIVCRQGSRETMTRAQGPTKASLSVEKGIIVIYGAPVAPCLPTNHRD